MSKYIEVVSRFEDMSPRGHLKLLRDGDGDIIVAVYNDDGNGYIDTFADIEFCTGMGGGSSPNTFKALLALMEAMEMDNQESPHKNPDAPKQEQEKGK